MEIEKTRGVLGRSQRRSLVVEVKRRNAMRKARRVWGRAHRLYGGHCDLERGGRDLSVQHGGTGAGEMIVGSRGPGMLFESKLRNTSTSVSTFGDVPSQSSNSLNVGIGPFCYDCGNAYPPSLDSGSMICGVSSSVAHPGRLGGR